MTTTARLEVRCVSLDSADGWRPFGSDADETCSRDVGGRKSRVSTAAANASMILDEGETEAKRMREREAVGVALLVVFVPEARSSTCSSVENCGCAPGNFTNLAPQKQNKKQPG